MACLQGEDGAFGYGPPGEKGVKVKLKEESQGNCCFLHYFRSDL